MAFGRWQTRKERISRLKLLVQREVNNNRRDEMRATNLSKIRQQTLQRFNTPRLGPPEPRPGIEAPPSEPYAELFARQRNILGTQPARPDRFAIPDKPFLERLATSKLLTESVLGESAGERVRSIPVVGPALERNALPATTVPGLAATALFPAATLYGIGAATAGSLAGQLAEDELGAPRNIAGTGIGSRSALELGFGAYGGPGGGVKRGAPAVEEAAQRAGRTIEETGGLGAQPGRLLRGEQGGTQFGGSEFDAVPEGPLASFVTGRPKKSGLSMLSEDEIFDRWDNLMWRDGDYVNAWNRRPYTKSGTSLPEWVGKWRNELSGLEEEMLRRSATSEKANRYASEMAEFVRGRGERFADSPLLRGAGELGQPRLTGSDQGISNAGDTPDVPGQPPREPPTGVAPEPSKPSLSGVTRHQARAEETTLHPGRTTQVPGVKQVLSWLTNPSVKLPRQVTTRYIARQSASQEVVQNIRNSIKPLWENLSRTWDEATPNYIGPADNPHKLTIKDWADNPEFYEGVTPALRGAADEFDAANTAIINDLNDQYGLKIGVYTSGKPGSFYLPTMLSKETAEDLAKELPTPSSTSVSKRAGVTKTRAYEGAYQRWQNTGESLETDLGSLMNAHTDALGRLAGNSTFREGLGRTRSEIMEELHPKLFQRMTSLRQRMQSLRATVRRLDDRSGAVIDDFLNDPDSVELSDLADALDVRVGGKGRNAGKDAAALQAEIDATRQEIRKLRPDWESAGTGKYQRSAQTFKYHEPDELKGIDSVLRSDVFGGEVLDAVEEVRLFRFGGDISPFSIQGMIGLAGHVLTDPIAFAKTFPRAMAELWSPGGLDRLLAANPEEAARFAASRGRAAGRTFPEIYQAGRGIERIPGARVINERAISALEYINYQMWRADTNFLQKWGGKSQTAADAEAANFLSKLMPGLNPAERGVSAARGKVERAPFVSLSFTSAPGLIVKDATSGMAKLAARGVRMTPRKAWQSLNGREQLAIVRGATLVGTLSSMSVAAWTAHGIAQGKSPEEAANDAVGLALNPDKSNRRFLSIAVPGTDYFIPVGGPFRSFAVAMVPQKVGEVEGVPAYVPFAGMPNYLKARVTPAVTTPYYLARNRDYSNDPIMKGALPEKIARGVWYGLENSVLPLTLSAPSEQIRTGKVDPTTTQGAVDLFAEGAVHFAGQDTRVPTVGEERTLEISEILQGAPPEVAAQAGRPKHELDIDAELYIQDNENVKALSDQIDQRQRDRGDKGQLAADQVAEARATIRAKQDQLDAGFNSGEISPEDYVEETTNNQREAWARADQVYSTLDFPKPDASKTPIRAALDAYFAIEPRRVNGEMDWDTFDAEREEALAPLSPTQRAAAKEWLLRNKTDTERKLDEAKDLRGQYYDKPRWQSVVKNQDVLREIHKGVEELRLEAADQYGAMNIPAEKVYAEYARRHPEYDELTMRQAYKIRPGTKLSGDLENPELVEFLKRYESQLKPFFPELYSIGVRAEIATGAGR